MPKTLVRLLHKIFVSKRKEERGNKKTHKPIITGIIKFFITLHFRKLKRSVRTTLQELRERSVLSDLTAEDQDIVLVEGRYFSRGLNGHDDRADEDALEVRDHDQNEIRDQHLHIEPGGLLVMHLGKEIAVEPGT